MQELLIPGMQHCQKTDTGSKAARVCSNREKRFRRRSEKQVVNHFWIAERERREFAW
jgi:hypothetical protein